MIPTPFAADDARERGAGGGRVHLDRAVNQRAAELQPDAQRLGELAGPRGEIARTPDSASGVHEVEAFERLNGPDQDRRSHALVLAHRVQQRVDPVEKYT